MIHYILKTILNTKEVIYYGDSSTQFDAAERGFHKDNTPYVSIEYNGVNYEITQISGKQSGNGPADYSHKIEVNSNQAGAQSVSNRDYEDRLQDQYRQIRLLDPKYITTFTEEFFALVRK